ncbi:hypothetical protein ACFX13_008927 [Malus domestica]|uniref:uncharacterized protein LOC126591795 n=1 Tax=Malus sylvestris TaxID=3752 RepID=UPI0010AAF483|nr:uncharacterized protein LOC103449659 [Malus domestica]XP_050113433.1 uncharacterized protein LOC126591795 [Malus sylvestris]XP_050113434.1 uncharacterized protein LOC126591795 [Malus sylvestris]XP_050113435.1 uncharacterized protein LOC126591795 [Malus sylvestris]XP_050113437.1 uncharacterized protein LOC126591795 [Malus sylvestris]XP_050113438.1 uncharacterized protein LOC126591795 [Malus sylvestris]XP_050113439.1 uncharacterized protein LOC126591795 [Malus sylvestris]XP_050113440.1 unch
MICFRFSISMAKLLTSSSPETRGLESQGGLLLFDTNTQMRLRKQVKGSMGELLMAGRYLFSLQSMGQMQRGFIKEGFLKLYQNQGTGQEVAVLGEGTKMTTDTVITGGEVAVGVGIGMTVTDTMVGTETTVDEAGAVVPVLITTGAGEGGAMMMKGGV